MGYLAEEIAGVASELGISIVTVDQQLTLQIKEKLAKKFSTDKERSQILSWQNLEGRESYHDSNSWQLIKNYVGNQEVLLFVNPELEQIMWQFQNGEDLDILLGETTGFPFCVTSEKVDYMICFEDHDVLIGVGKAKKWVATHRVQRSRKKQR